MSSTAFDSRPANALATNILVLAGLASLLLAGYGLDLIAPKDPVALDPALAIQFTNPGSFHPKPHDRFIFPAIVVCGFLLLALIATVWRRQLKQIAEPRAAFLLCAALSAGIALWLGMWGGLLQLFSGPHLAGTVFCLVVAVAAAWISVKGRTGRSRAWLIVALFLFAAIFNAATRIFTASTIEYTPYISSHYEAVVYSIVHIAGGGTCLADVLPQYGCYGEFIAPIVRLIGASPFALTLILATLQSFAILAIIVFSAKLLRTNALLVVAVGCVLILTSIILVLGSPDPVFQYNPIRLLFPAFSLLCVLALQRNPSLRNAFLIGGFAGASLAWNVDTGVAVVGSLGAFTLAVGFTGPGWWSRQPLLAALKRLALFLTGLLVFLAAFYFYLAVKSGWRVDLGAAIAYQHIFYVAGLAMVPLPAFPDLWTIAAIVIAIGILAAMAGVSRESDPLLELAFYLAILSIGLMLYYSGRSLWLVLRFVVWPEVILFLYLAERSFAASKATAKLVTIAAIVFLPLAATVFYFPICSTVVANRWKPAPGSEQFKADIAFMKSLTTPGENIAIIAENQSSLYAASGTWPAMKGTSLAELQRALDRDALKEAVAKEGPKKVFVDSAPMSISFQSRWIDLQSHYDLKATGPDGRLQYFVRRD